MTCPCPQADNVVALFLDGDAQPRAEQDHQDLSQHLADCRDCQRALGRARRLDAALASSSGLVLDPQRAERLLAGALAVATQGQNTASLRLGPLPLALAAVALVLTGVGIGLLWLADPRPKPVPTVSEPDHRFFPLPPLPAGTQSRMAISHTRARPPEHLVLAAVLRSDRRQLRPLVLSALVLAGTLHWHSLPRRARLLEDGVREQAGCRLLQSRRAPARRALLAYLAAGRPDPVLSRMLDHAAGNARFLGFVRGELHWNPEGPALAAAARLAVPALDRLLCETCRGRRLRCEQLAAALASIDHRTGRTELLLDLWQGLTARGLVADPKRLAERWFQGLPGATTLELAAVAEATGDARRRHHCILALGVRSDPAALPYLLELIAGPGHDDAVLAAQALGQLPPAAVDVRVMALAARSRRPYLLLAALASMRSPRVQTHIQAMELTEVERQFLAAGRFNPEQFSLAARLFRNRQRLTD